MPRPDLRTAIPYLADAASVVFVAAGTLLVFSAAGELRSPGMAASVLAPQTLIAVAAVAGLLALLSPPRSPSRLARVGYACMGLLATALAGVAAWHGFVSLGEARPWLAVTTLLVVASSFILFRGRTSAS
jgi:hypothetical protein